MQGSYLYITEKRLMEERHEPPATSLSAAEEYNKMAVSHRAGRGLLMKAIIRSAEIWRNTTLEDITVGVTTVELNQAAAAHSQNAEI